jgi:hypothetical protein
MLKVESRRSVESRKSKVSCQLDVYRWTIYKRGARCKSKANFGKKSNVKINKLNKFDDVLTANLHQNSVLTDETTNFIREITNNQQKCTYIEIGIFRKSKTYEFR